MESSLAAASPPQVLSRAVEDSGTVTSVLVPWNTCGAYISGVLGVSTAAYFPFCFFNLLSPLLDIIYGYVGFKVPEAEAPWEDEATTATLSQPSPEETPMIERPRPPRRRSSGGFKLPSAYTILFG